MQSSASYAARADLWFRVMLSGIFVVAGLQHVLHPAAVTAHLVRSRLGAALATMVEVGPLIAMAGIVLLAGGVALMLGAQTRLTAVVLALTLLPVTVIVQIGPDTLGPLFKNVAILGGLVHFAANGAGATSIDALARARRRQGEPS